MFIITILFNKYLGYKKIRKRKRKAIYNINILTQFLLYLPDYLNYKRILIRKYEYFSLFPIHLDLVLEFDLEDKFRLNSNRIFDKPSFSYPHTFSNHVMQLLSNYRKYY